jgi:FkbM family methyltransferase
MTTHTPESHYAYTINEYNNTSHTKYLNYIFKNSNIKVIYDIGANSGATCNIFYEYSMKYNNPLKKIYLFEPDETNYEYLLNSTKQINNVVESFNLGIYYGATTKKVFLPKMNNEAYYTVGGFSISPELSHRSYIETDKIFNLTTLEELNIDEPDFVKIDIEGCEKNLIINSSIIKKAKFMLVEWQDKEDFNVILNKYLNNYKIIFNDHDYLLEKIN